MYRRLSQEDLSAIHHKETVPRVKRPYYSQPKSNVHLGSYLIEEINKTMKRGDAHMEALWQAGLSYEDIGKMYDMQRVSVYRRVCAYRRSKNHE